ncbi:MAG: putative toxin-antitoxin system toxin component, PIN family [Candidatus Aureabacteria bacterium]|nr:putative toxin-antitoxin system toxin component, PIN family [Candidatus Auribacterota bacterium]
MNVVVDTNVFISSFFGGNPRAIIDLWKSGNIILCLSRAIIAEYISVLKRMGLADEPELEEILSVFRRGVHCQYYADPPPISMSLADPTDAKFVECAVALKAAAIISGDRHLLSIGDYCGIRIVTPRKFLELRK